MQWKRLHRASPEQGFVVVRNVESSTMTKGYAVMWQASVLATYGSGTADGYSVQWQDAAATASLNPGLFAGLVAEKDIPPSDYGFVQVYGYFDGAVVTGGLTNAASNTTNETVATRIMTRPNAQWTQADLSKKILAPANNFTTEAAFTGLLAYIPFPGNAAVITTNTMADNYWKWIWAYGAPKCIPLDQCTPTTLATNSSGTCKVFIRCM